MARILNILCVDDHADSLELLRYSLETQRHIVRSARSASEATDLIERRHFDLYIVDIEMPKIDGLTLCRRIRAIDKHTPIIIYSAGDRAVDSKAGYEAGATMCVSKPDGLETILAIANTMRDSATAIHQTVE